MAKFVFKVNAFRFDTYAQLFLLW